jgi:dTDP-4-dehydrorhamnose reductase
MQEMKMLILGGSGMLGHKLWQTASRRLETHVTFHGQAETFAHSGLFDIDRSVSNVSAEDFPTVQRAFDVAQPDVAVNCIGVVKQVLSSKDPITSITINALFPHRLASLCRERGVRLIHLSTDCVFSGQLANYEENDLPDPPDLYGRSKLLGEVSGENCLTIRTSMIGRELQGSHGLLEWFLAQNGGRVRGFKRAIFSGFTTAALAEVIMQVIVDHPGLTGIWHLASEPISKFDLLTLVKQTYGLAVEIEPDESFICDRSLNAKRFRDATGIRPPSWCEMIEQMFRDPTPYDQIRGNR